MRSALLSLSILFGAMLLVPRVVFAVTTCGGELYGKLMSGTCYSSCPSGTESSGHCVDPDSWKTTDEFCCIVPPVGSTAAGYKCVNTYKGECLPSDGCFISIGASDCGDSKTCCTVPATSSKGSPTTLTNPLGQNVTFFTVIQRVISNFLGFVGALALLVFVYAGVTWMTAGSSDRVQQAKDSMKYAVIGLALITFSYAITQFFFKTLGRG